MTVTGRVSPDVSNTALPTGLHVVGGDEWGALVVLHSRFRRYYRRYSATSFSFIEELDNRKG